MSRIKKITVIAGAIHRSSKQQILSHLPLCAVLWRQSMKNIFARSQSPVSFNFRNKSALKASVFIESNLFWNVSVVLWICFELMRIVEMLDNNVVQNQLECDWNVEDAKCQQIWICSTKIFLKCLYSLFRIIRIQTHSQHGLQILK